MSFQRHAVYALIGCVLFLIVIGMIMLSSTSAFAQDSRGDMNYFIKRQAIWLLVGVIVCVGVSLMDYHLLQKYWWIYFLISQLSPVNSSKKWMSPRFLSGYPSFWVLIQKLLKQVLGSWGNV